MAQLRQDYPEYSAREAVIIVVGPDAAAAFRKYWETHQLPFIGLPDPRYSVLRRYGQEVNIFKLGRMPAQAVIDKQGCVRYVHYGKSMADIPSTAELLAVLDGLNREDASLENAR